MATLVLLALGMLPRDYVVAERVDRIEVNHVYDGAPIYVLGPVAAPGAPLDEHMHIRGNFANNGSAGPQFKVSNDTVDSEFTKRPGIQLDAGVRNIVIEDNVLAGNTVWFQLTEWSFRSNEAGWVDGLALTGSGNWSDTPAALPRDTSLVGVGPAAVFDPVTLPPAVRRIIEGAGLEPEFPRRPCPSPPRLLRKGYRLRAADYGKL